MTQLLETSGTQREDMKEGKDGVSTDDIVSNSDSIEVIVAAPSQSEKVLPDRPCIAAKSSKPLDYALHSESSQIASPVNLARAKTSQMENKSKPTQQQTAKAISSNTSSLPLPPPPSISKQGSSPSAKNKTKPISSSNSRRHHLSHSQGNILSNGPGGLTIDIHNYNNDPSSEAIYSHGLTNKVAPVIATEKDDVLLPSAESLGSRLYSATTPLSSAQQQPQPSGPSIDDDSPAAAALRANADVRVSKMQKIARRFHAQTVRRMVKKGGGALLLRSGSGDRRGKPPRVPSGGDENGGDDEEGWPGKNKSSLADVPEMEENDDDSNDKEKMDGDEEESPSDRETENILDEPEEASIDSSKKILSRHRFPSSPRRSKSAPIKSDKSSFRQLVKDAASSLTMVDAVDVDEDDSSSRLKKRGNAVTWDDGAGETSVGTSNTSDRKAKGKPKSAEGDYQGLFHERKWRRRKKSLEKKQARKSYVKGKVIDGEHELYTLSIAVMLGLRTSIGMTNGQLSNAEDLRAWIDSDDFMSVEKYIFRPNGGLKTPPHQLSHTFKFKDYSPLAFAYIRRMFGINEYEFLLSVCGNANFIEFISNAKSGQFFFYSNDGKYMIKTMTNAESKFLRRILPHYFRHCAQNANTLITKFLGMYRVKLYHLRRNVKFVIMNSVFNTDKFLQSFYDLKGSKIGREAKPGESVKKDNDVRKGMPDAAFALPPAVRNRMRSQVERDCAFLKEMKIMDYSMLIGVHHIPPKQGFAGPGRQIKGISFQNQSSLRTSSRDSASIRDVVQKWTQPAALQALQPLNTSRRPHNEGQETTNVLKAARGRQDAKSFDGDSYLDPSLDAPEDMKLSDLMCPNEAGEHVRASSFGDTLLPSLIFHDPMSPMEERIVNDVFGDRSVASYSTIDHYFDEDDDYSFLEGSNRRLRAPTEGDESRTKQNDGEEEDWINRRKLDALETKKEDATEQIYWPFHRFYDIQGRRRMIPLAVPESIFDSLDNHTTKEILDNSNFKEPDSGCGSCFEDRTATQPNDVKAPVKWKLPDFETPISNRKDAGLMMDVAGLELPLKMEGSGKKVFYYEGKIFYMGIIDVLQQFSIRKRVEARWRRLQGGGWEDASCVHPNIYADRFLRFFDEYTQRIPLEKPELIGGGSDSEGEEEVVFSSDASIKDDSAHKFASIFRLSISPTKSSHKTKED